jgi:hypothetical protein
LCHGIGEEIEHFAADSLALRQFCRVYPQLIRGDTTLLRRAHLIGAAAASMLNARLVALARWLG